MSARFITSQDIKRESFEWGESGWVARPSLTGSTGLCVSFTVGEEDAKLWVILTPTAGDDGYSVATKFVARS
jgi:hypothetical protein